VIADPLESAEEGAAEAASSAPRQRFILDDTGFDEVPEKYRRFYRRWRGPDDSLAPNEVICPVCSVVIRSTRELRPGDRVYCMPCMSRLTVVRAASGRLEAHVIY
jgi:hypothetical protein